MSFKEVSLISKSISTKCDENYRQQISNFFEKSITMALRLGHGNLIAVVDDSEDSLQKLAGTEKNGTYLPTPINFEQLVIEAETDKATKLPLT
jgi:hypothetical protein